MAERILGRRAFLSGAAALAGAAVLGGRSYGVGQRRGGLCKALQYRMLPGELSDVEKFKLAAKCGYEGIEGGVMADLKAAAEMGRKARDSGVPIHSIVYGGWGAPLSDPRAEVVEQGLSGMKTALASAKALGAGAVLLVPALVTETVSYGEAYRRSQENIRKLIRPAEDAGVVIAVENVWNKFLLSPVEFARYVDEFESPWIRAYFDVGNVIIFGYAQDWIRTLGKRIVRIHLKDFKRSGYKWTNLLEGDVNWQEVRRALADIGYDGFLTPELGGGDEAYLQDLSGRIDKIISM